MSDEHSFSLHRASTEYRDLAGKLRELARACVFPGPRRSLLQLAGSFDCRATHFDCRTTRGPRRDWRDARMDPVGVGRALDIRYGFADAQTLTARSMPSGCRTRRFVMLQRRQWLMHWLRSDLC